MIMGLFVPPLRTAMVLLNVWETYKTLKPPPPSKRNGGKPSVRAASQRKRDMKGCLTIWIVWCLFAVYERTVERPISMFIPFYDEFKSIMILALIFARSRLAEPIFLHVVRPALKPYAPTIDFILEETVAFGDLFALLIALPVELVIEYIPKSMRADEEAMNSRESTFLGNFESRRHAQQGTDEGLPITSSPYPVWANDENARNPSFANIYNGPPTPPPEHHSLPKATANIYTSRASASPSPEPIPVPMPFASGSAHKRPTYVAHSTDAENGYSVEPIDPAFPWPEPQQATHQTLPPGFCPSVQA